MQKGGTAVKRSSGRIKAISQKYRVTNELLQDMSHERTASRLEILESDNYRSEKKGADEDDELFQPEKDDDGFSKQKRKKRKTNVRKVKNFATVIEDEKLEAYPSHVPTYLTVVAAPSSRPIRFFCSVCGHVGTYTCTRCGSRYCCSQCYQTHQDTRCLKWTI